LTPHHEAKPKTVWIKSNWRLLAVAVAATLLVAAFVIVVLTAPISELVVTFRNTEDADTVHIAVYLDNSPAANLYVGADGSSGLRLHVSPGTYTVSLDFAYNGQLNETVDFLWTTYVGFNGIAYNNLVVNRYGVGPDLLIDYSGRPSPILQAVRDLNVMAPALTLAVLDAILVMAIWSYRKHDPTRIRPGKDP
jgi:hypothetical protein